MSRFKTSPGNDIDGHVERFKADMAELGFQVRILEVRRSIERQEALYAQGRTAPGPVVTWTKQSKHIRGRAFDFDFIDSLDKADDASWLAAAEIGDGLGLTWGGDWSVQDNHHFELPD